MITEKMLDDAYAYLMTTTSRMYGARTAEDKAKEALQMAEAEAYAGGMITGTNDKVRAANARMYLAPQHEALADAERLTHLAECEHALARLAVDRLQWQIRRMAVAGCMPGDEYEMAEWEGTA